MRPSAASALVLTLLVAACRESGDDHATSEAALSDGVTLSETMKIVPVGGPSALLQEHPALATDGKDFLAVWRECLTTEGTPDCFIRASRISAAGKVIDDQSLIFPHKTGTNDSAPSVAFDGTSYLVAWSTRVEGYNEPIQTIRVSADGKLLASTATKLGKSAWSPQVASNGDGWMIAYNEELTVGAPSQIYTARIDADGTPQASSKLTSKSFPLSRSFSISAAGGMYFVAWSEGNYDATNVFGLRVGADNVALDRSEIVFTSDGGNGRTNAYPSVTSNGNAFLVAYNVSEPGTDLGARVQLVGTSGELVGDTKKATESGYSVDASFDGTSFVVASSLGLLKLDAQLNPGPLVPAPAGSAGYRAVTASAHGTTMTLRGHDLEENIGVPFDRQLTSAVYDANLTLLKSDIRPARAKATTRNVTAARNGNEYLIVWEEFRRDWKHTDIRGAIVKDGKLGEATFLIHGETEGVFQHPTAVFDGTNYAVAWDENGNGIGGVRVDPTGIVIGEAKHHVHGIKPKLVAAGDAVFLATPNDVFGFDEAFTPSSAPLFHIADEIAASTLVFDGKELVAGWMPKSQREINTRRYALNGIPTSETITLDDKIGEGTFPTGLSSTTDGHGQTLIAWADGIVRRFAFGAMVDSTGVKVPRTVLGSASKLDDNVFQPSVAYSGRQWLVGFEVRVNPKDPLSTLDIVGARPGVDESSFADTHFSLAPAGGLSPSLISDGEGHGLATYIFEGGVQLRTFTDVAPPPPPGDDAKPAPPIAPPDDAKPAGEEPSTPTNPTPAAPPAPTKTTLSAGCSAAPGSGTTGFPLLLLIGAVLAGRRRRAR